MKDFQENQEQSSLASEHFVNMYIVKNGEMHKSNYMVTNWVVSFSKGFVKVGLGAFTKWAGLIKVVGILFTRWGWTSF